MELRERVRHSLEEKLGVEETTYLMDRPPGGWSELVTRQMLEDRLAVTDAKFETALAVQIGAVREDIGAVREDIGAVRREFGTETTSIRSELTSIRSELHTQIVELSASVDRRLRAQTWVTATTLIAGLGLFGIIQRL